MNRAVMQNSHGAMMARDRHTCASAIHKMYAGQPAGLVGSLLKIHAENVDQVMASLLKCHRRRDMYNMHRLAIKMGGLFVELDVVYLSLLCHELANHAEKGEWRSVKGLIETLGECWPTLREDIKWLVEHYLE